MKLRSALSALLLLSLAGTGGFSLCRADAPPQIVVACKVLTLPPDSPAIKEAGLSLDAGAAMTNLGVVSTEKVAAMLAKLEKAPGASITSVPAVSSNSGSRGNLQSVHEFSYATEFTPAKLTAGEGTTQLPAGQMISATPTTPTAFEMRPVGMRIEYEATADGDLIRINIAPEVVTFEGFVNYGSPIKAAALDKDGKLQEVTLAENRVPQPLFHSFKVVTGASLPSGHCLVFGGAGSSLKRPNLTGQTPTGQEKDISSIPAKPAEVMFFFIQVKAVKV